MGKSKKWLSFLLVISVLMATVFGGSFSGQMKVSAKTKKNVKSITVISGGKNVTHKTITMVMGKTMKLAVKNETGKTKNSVKFASSKKSVASVSKKGKVTAKKKGTAKIKVTVSGKYKKKVTWVKIKVRAAGEQTNYPTETPTQPTTEPSVTEAPAQPTTEPSEAETPAIPTTEPSVTETPVQPSGGKVLVAYFSRTGENYGVGVIEKGNTAIIADMIAEQTGGTEFEVAAVSAYPDVYSECTQVAQQEKEQNARPELKGSLPVLDEYDTIFVGYPKMEYGISLCI